MSAFGSLSFFNNRAVFGDRHTKTALCFGEIQGNEHSYESSPAASVTPVGARIEEIG